MPEAAIRSLLICDDVPSFRYGTGQRLLTIRKALGALGECRVLHLTNNDSGPKQSADYTAPLPFDFRASRVAWAMRRLSFAEARRDERYRSTFEHIQREFSFDLLFCSFFRNAPAVPTDMAPCLLDLDAIPERTGKLTRTLWPLSLSAMRRRARDFRALYVIRPSDAELFSGCGPTVRVLPGISSSAPDVPPPRNNEARRILFVAPTNWPPNREAVDWLLEIGVPDSLYRMGYELRLIGEGTNEIAARPGLSCGGFVEDLAAEYAAARLVLCPIWSGGGANIKLAEAAQFGCAILATTHAAGGYHGLLQPDQDLVTFDRRSEFLDLLIALLGDSDRLRGLESRARRAASEILNQRYFNDVIAQDIAAIRGLPQSGTPVPKGLSRPNEVI